MLRKILEWTIAITLPFALRFIVLLIEATIAFVIGSSGILFTIFVSIPNDWDYTITFIIFLLPFVPAMTVPAWLDEKYFNVLLEKHGIYLELC